MSSQKQEIKVMLVVIAMLIVSRFSFAKKLNTKILANGKLIQIKITKKCLRQTIIIIPIVDKKDRQTGARQFDCWYMSLTKFNHAFVVRI